MDKFLDTYDHPNLNQTEINHIKRSVTRNEIEATLKSLPKKKCPWSAGFSIEFSKILKTYSQHSIKFSIK
jgi:hypothetical protein